MSINSKPNLKLKSRGISLIEIMIAFALLALIIPSSAVLVMNGYAAYLHSSARHSHFLIAKKELEIYLRLHRPKAPFVIATSSVNTYPDTNVQISIIPRGILSAQISIHVQGIKGLFQERESITLSQLITDSSLSGATDSCELYLKPATTTPILQQRGRVVIDANNTLTGIIVKYPYAFISANSIATSSPDLFVLDISSSTKPFILASIDTGRGLTNLTFAYPYLFALNTGTAHHIQTINISNPIMPRLISTFKLPNFGTSTAPAASAIMFSNNFLYVGVPKWLGKELGVLDVHDPIHIQYRGGIEIDSIVKDIFVSSTGTAYVATAGERELLKIDISNPDQLLITNSFSSIGWQVLEGNRIHAEGPYLYFGRAGGGFNNITQHEAFILSNNFSLIRSFDIPSGIYGIVSYFPYLFLAGTRSGKELEIRDQRNPSSTPVYFSTNQSIKRLTCDGQLLYALTGNGNSFLIFTL